MGALTFKDGGGFLPTAWTPLWTHQATPEHRDAYPYGSSPNARLKRRRLVLTTYANSRELFSDSTIIPPRIPHHPSPRADTGTTLSACSSRHLHLPRGLSSAHTPPLFLSHSCTFLSPPKCIFRRAIKPTTRKLKTRARSALSCSIPHCARQPASFAGVSSPDGSAPSRVVGVRASGAVEGGWRVGYLWMRRTDRRKIGMLFRPQINGLVGSLMYTKAVHFDDTFAIVFSLREISDLPPLWTCPPGYEYR